MKKTLWPKRLKLSKITTVATAIVFLALILSPLSAPKPVLAWSCGEDVTYAGQDYDTVLIGSQCWMAENLNVTNGNTDQSCSITRYCYGDISSNCNTYGGLYTWADMMCGEASCNGTGESQPACTTPVQGICPDGWHIPSHYEYVALEREVCDSDSATCATYFPYDESTTGWGGTDEGSKLAGNATLWADGVLDAHVNFGASGLDLLPAGYYYNADSSYGSLGDLTNIWSSLGSGGNAWRHGLYYTRTDVGWNSVFGELYGMSVRCLKDSEEGEEAAVPEFTTITFIIAAVCGFGIYFVIRRVKEKAAK